jgi:putative N6-adenine-specific DNA methylase
MTFHALCSPGLESVVKRELEHLGLGVDRVESARVQFKANKEELLRCLYGLRTADRILWHLVDRPLANTNDLFDLLLEQPWEEWISFSYFPVIEKVRVERGTSLSQVGLQSLAHKAILQRLGRHHGLLRWDESKPKIALRIYAQKESLEVGLDLTPLPLSQRGYKLQAGEAPLRQTVAAALVILSRLKRHDVLWDPLCGSGTIIAEALLWMMNRAPNLHREFSLPPTLGIEPSVYYHAQQYWRDQEVALTKVNIYAGDKDPRALQRAQENLNNLNLTNHVLQSICWVSSDLEKAVAPNIGAILLTNPPWGQRMEDQQTARRIVQVLGERFYRDKLKVLGFLSSLPDAAQVLKIPRSCRHPLRLGGLSVQMIIANSS